MSRRFWWIAGLLAVLANVLLIVGSDLPVAATTSGPSLVNTLTVGSGPFATSDDGTDVWVTNSNSHSVTEISVATGSVVNASIPAGTSPEGIYSNGTHVWVTDQGSPTVTVLNATNPMSGATTVSNVCNDPRGVVGDGSEVWIACYYLTTNDSGGVVGLNESTSAVDYRLAMPTGSLAQPMSVISDGSNLYVAGASNNFVYRFAIPSGTPPVTQTLSPTWSFDTATSAQGGGAGSAGLALIGNNLFVGSIWTPYVVEVDATTGLEVRALTIDPSLTCTSSVCNYALAAQGNELWVTNTGTSTLSEFDGTTGALLWGPTVVGGSAGGALGIGADSNHVWVALNGSGQVAEDQLFTPPTPPPSPTPTTPMTTASTPVLPVSLASTGANLAPEFLGALASFGLGIGMFLLRRRKPGANSGSGLRT
jgi:DNA-binding beta-propeller fold protein YncE